MDFDLDTKTDEDFFGALKRKTTNLGHLFGCENKSDEQEETLKYQPTKATAANGALNRNKSQNAASSTTSSPTANVQAWQTLLAKVVQAYKEGVPVGKVGVALLQNAEKEYRIIVYKTKLNVLSNCTLRAEIPQVHRRNNYLQFYDDDSICWSIYFDADANTEEFVAKLIELNIEVRKDEEDQMQEASKNLSTDSECITDEKSEPNSISQFKIRELMDKPPITAGKPTSKSTLITRMAKMGGQALPKLPTLPQHVQSSVDATDDSSDTETISTRMALAPTQHKHQPAQRSSNRALAKAQVMPVSEVSYVTQTPAVAGVGAFESQFMQMMLTENRTHNTELRMNMGKLESKVEKVLDKIDLLQSSAGAQNGNKEDELLALEEKVLELKKENRRLRQAIEEKPMPTPTPSCEQILQIYCAELEAANLANVDSLESLVGDLLRQRASLQEKLEQWERDLAVKSNELKSHQTRLDDDQDMLAKTIAQKEQFEAEVQSYQKRLADKEKLESDLRDQLAESHKECIAQRQQYEDAKQKETHANDLISELRVQNQQLEHELLAKSKTEMVIRENHASGAEAASENNLAVEKQIETVLKKTMNNLYANLATKLENIETMQKNGVVAIVGKTIREETLKAMDDLKKK